MGKKQVHRRKDYSYHGLLVACNLCGSRNQETITKKDRVGYKTNIVLCKDCGLVYTNPLPTIEEVKLFYNKKLNKNVNPNAYPKLKRILRAAQRALPRFNRIKPYIKHDSKVLDASACGAEFLYLLKKKGIEGVGVEFNNLYHDFARAELGIELTPQFLDEIKFEANSFDLIVAYHILNLYLNPSEALRKFHTFLKPGGHLNIEVPNVESTNTAPFNRFKFKHFYNFNLYSIQTLCRKAGFEVLNTILIPGSHHINMILKKTEPQILNARNYNNYLSVKDCIKGYKSLNYLITAQPYIKIFQNLKKHLKLVKMANSYSSGKEILDECFKEFL